jgi:putative toxin-antitoxin system antitoxin component (TIGR02293 family)
MKPFSLMPAYVLMQEVRQGLPTAALRRFMKESGLEESRVLHALQISRRTLERRAQQRLDPVQSDRFVRVKRIYDQAAELFHGDAAGWLQDRNRMLEGAAPLDLLDTEVGAEAVAAVLWGVERGLPA